MSHRIVKARPMAGILALSIMSAGCSSPSATAVVPPVGSSVGGTTARLFGTGFRAGMTLTVGDARVVDYALLGSTIIDLTLPPHAPGVVDIVLTSPSDEGSRLVGVFTYVDYPPPVVATLAPTRVSTQGSPVYIKGTGFTSGTSVTIDGTRASVLLYADTLYTAAPPHLEGTVNVVVTNADGQTVRLVRALTYAAPESFDFNGEWEGEADNGFHEGTVIRFTIRNNVMVSLACGAGSNLLPIPAPLVVRGQISSVGNSVTGRTTSEGVAEGSIAIAPCGGHVWSASKK
jgi:hypothetical protein